MSTEKMREEFEAWAMKKHSHYLAPFKRVNGSDPRIDGADRYLHSEVQQDWAVWQASRAAIEVELPAVSDYFDKSEYPHTCDLLECDLRISIGYHGLKVKS